MGKTIQVSQTLILIEGLTGCGKSSLAHYLSRQLEANGVPHTWVHEAETPHPLWPPEELPIGDFIRQMPGRWETFLENNRQAGKIAVVEACFFNNLVEELFIEDIPRDEIIEFGMHMQEVIRPYHPALVYLRRGPVAEALKLNFADRGEGFRDFVIDFTSGTKYSKAHQLTGYDGMVTFWQDLIAIYEELFERYTIDRLLIENPREDWAAYNRQALEFLGIAPHPDPKLSKSDAHKYLGEYRLQHNDESWTVQYDNELQALRLNKFILIPQTGDHFLISSHHFEIQFITGAGGQVTGFEVGGRDIDYLQLVGTHGIKVM